MATGKTPENEWTNGQQPAINKAPKARFVLQLGAKVKRKILLPIEDFSFVF
ncbi:MAG TPA: hypothetical protein VIM59_12920 [Cellvibrio sp.]